MKIRLATLSVIALTLMAVALVACSSDDDDTNDSKPTATTEAAATEALATGEVDVRLFEYTVDPAVASVPAGEVVFNVGNVGGADHDLRVIRTDLAPDALPTLDDGSVDESAADVEVVGALDTIGPSLSSSGSLNMEPGTYVLICNIVDDLDTGPRAHYELGMYAAFEVTE